MTKPSTKSSEADLGAFSCHMTPDRKPWYSNPRTNEGDQTLNLFLHAGVLWVGKVLDTLMISAIFRVMEEVEENTKDTAREPPSPLAHSIAMKTA